MLSVIHSILKHTDYDWLIKINHSLTFIIGYDDQGLKNWVFKSLSWIIVQLAKLLQTIYFNAQVYINIKWFFTTSSFYQKDNLCLLLWM